MLFTDLIRIKRDGGELTDDQLQFFVDGLAGAGIGAGDGCCFQFDDIR